MEEAKQFQPTKPRFLDICINCGIDYQTLQAIADRAGVSYSLLYDMFIDHPVARVDAEKILLQLSQYAGQFLDLDTVDVPVLGSEPHSHQHSEVACLKAQIQEEYEAAQQAMSGFALGTAQHRFINARMENMARHLDTLHVVAGEEVFRQTLAELGEA